MEMTIEQAVGLLGELWQKRELDQLHATACEIAKQRPTISQSWRYRGIVDVLRGGGINTCAKLHCSMMAKPPFGYLF